MHVAVTAFGVDRPGIVAAVTGVLFKHGANIEDSRMAILGGHFAMMLIVATDADPGTLEAELFANSAGGDLLVSVRRVAEAAPEHSDGTPFVLSVYGADHPGIVHRVARSLADKNVNITDLATRVIGEDPAVYLMVMEITLPGSVTAEGLHDELTALGSDLGVDISLRAADADTL